MMPKLQARAAIVVPDFRVTGFLFESLKDVAEGLRNGGERTFSAGPTIAGVSQSVDWDLIGEGMIRIEFPRRPPGRPKADLSRLFFMDPNRVAAALSDDVIENFREDWASENPGTRQPHLVPQADGKKKPLQAVAVDYAIELVKKEYVSRSPQLPHQLNPIRVRSLLAHSRSWPDWERTWY